MLNRKKTVVALQVPAWAGPGVRGWEERQRGDENAERNVYEDI